MRRLDLGIGDWGVSGRVHEIKTYALGSCVALVVWDYSARVGGMVHVALPDSVINPEKAQSTPGYFADTAVALLWDELAKQGATKQTCWVKLVGGASTLDKNNTYDIGRRNVEALKITLQKNGIALNAEDCGGTTSRTVTLDVSNGDVVISNGRTKWTL